MTEQAVSVRGLTRHFGRVVAVDNVDLDIPSSQIYGFLGPNGSGKTTIIRMLCGLLTPTRGSASVLGLQVPGQAELLRRQIGYMTQKFSLYEDLSVEENMRFMARIYGIGRRQAAQRTDELLQRYALTELRDRMASDMSGGQRQRLALATAVFHRPDMLFLDEPTSAVDPENRRDFWEKLFDLSDGGTTILVSTHYMDEAERCHNIAILDEGRLATRGRPRDLMSNLPAQVVEVTGPDPRSTKAQALQLPAVRSAAQQGLQLRIMLDPQIGDAVSYLQQHLEQPELTFTPGDASLEDVFVAATLGDGGR